MQKTLNLTILLSLLFGLAFSQTNQEGRWKLDQQNGNFWYAGESSIFTHDPYDNNPGTLIIVQTDIGREIRVYADIALIKWGKTKVRYAFDRNVSRTANNFDDWENIEDDSYGYVLMPSQLVESFISKAQTHQFVTIELIDKYEKAAMRTFVFQGLSVAVETLQAVPKAQSKDRERVFEYDYTYRKAKEKSGATSYIFEGESKPPITLSFDGDTNSVADVSEINVVLRLLNLPEVSYRVSELSSITGYRWDRASYLWESYPIGMLNIERTICKRTSVTHGFFASLFASSENYDCIWKVTLN